VGPEEVLKGTEMVLGLSWRPHGRIPRKSFALQWIWGQCGEVVWGDGHIFRIPGERLVMEMLSQTRDLYFRSR
jgi:hypothetical protein